MRLSSETKATLFSGAACLHFGKHYFVPTGYFRKRSLPARLKHDLKCRVRSPQKHKELGGPIDSGSPTPTQPASFRFSKRHQASVVPGALLGFLCGILLADVAN